MPKFTAGDRSVADILGAAEARLGSVRWRMLPGPGDCVVEVTKLANGSVQLRDRRGKVVSYTAAEWAVLADAIRGGDLDDLEVTPEQQRQWDAVMSGRPGRQTGEPQWR
jgi:hypothetical protein